MQRKPKLNSFFIILTSCHLVTKAVRILSCTNFELHGFFLVPKNVHLKALLYCQNDYSSFFFQTKIRLEYNIGWLYLFNGCFFFLFYHQIKSKRNPREQRDKRKIASSVPIGWTQFTFSSQNVCWNGLALLTQHSLIFLISTFSLDDKASFYLDPNF